MKRINPILTTLLLAAMLASPWKMALAQDAPTADTALDQLVKLDPATLAARIKAMKDESTNQANEATALKTKAVELDTQAEALVVKVTTLEGQVKALAEYFGHMKPAPAPTAMAAAPATPAKMETTAKASINYNDHVLPIMKQHCAKCHNEDKRKSGFAVSNFALLSEGGSSGPVFTPGDPDNSRIMMLITKQEEPFMPPSGDLSPEEIDTIRKWIAAGALPDASAKPTTTAMADTPQEEEMAFVAASFDGPPPMPEVQLATATTLDTRGVVARAIDTNPRSSLIAVGGNREVLLYNLDDFSLLGALSFPEGDVYDLTFSVNGTLLLAGGGQEGDTGIAVLWNIRTGERMGTYGEYYDTVLCADISPDHRLIALGGPNKKVRVYSVDTGAELYKLDPHTDWIYAVKFTPDGEVLSTADRSGNLFLWQASNGRPVEQLKGHTGAINALAYTNDSKFLVSAGDDGTVQVWDTWKYNRVRSFNAHGLPVLNLDVSATNQIITTGADNTTKVWEFDGKEQKKYDGLTDWGYSACFAQEGKTVLAGSWTGEIFVWNRETGETLKTLNTNPT